ncbi:unnamed protein product [Nyctereutes procyonoides]|uniref:(raccoon dog) hypothetical protein n=1 Tax=Nyctereutes procyonoides TaxID=34880 RepID=A0A811YEG1_NYCPR|nr:unnamed protein product [Nyctereutes procyonoides]
MNSLHFWGRTKRKHIKLTREQEPKVEPEDEIAWLCSHDQTPTNKELLLRDEQKKCLHEMGSTPGEDAVMTVEMMTKDLEHYIKLVDKTAAGFGRIDYFERSSTVGKALSNCTACCSEAAQERKTR